jgi:hypothetical protein
MRASYWTLSNRRSMTEGPPAKPASPIIAIAASNMFRSSTLSVSPKPGSSPSVGSVGDAYDNAPRRNDKRPLQG